MLHAHECRSSCVSLCLCENQSRMSSTFLYCFSASLSKTGSLRSQKLTVLARLTDQQVPGIRSFLPQPLPNCWGYRHAQPWQLLTQVLEFKLRSSGLESGVFTRMNPLPSSLNIFLMTLSLATWVSCLSTQLYVN